jgi:hypothetical protein
VKPPAVTENTLGAWLVKASPANLPVAELLRDGFASVTSRCVRPTYRVDLVAAGQPVLLWVSGRDPRHPAGIYAAGETTGPAERGDELSMPVRLQAVEPPVRREEILAVPGLADLEVLRMPAGSNPSYVDGAQYRTLRQAFPQLHIG